MATPPVPYLKGYLALRAQRRAELVNLQRRAGERKPAARFILAFFFGLFGSLFLAIVPLAAVFGVVALVSFSSGVKLIGVRRQVKRVLADENAKWNLRDRAVEKLGEKDFETLAKSLEANGSYESLSGWLKRKEFDEAEINTLILAAASAGEERQKMQVSVDLQNRAGGAARKSPSADERSARAYQEAFGIDSDESAFETRSENGDSEEPSETSTKEGLHAQLLAQETEESQAAMPPARRRSEDDPELDEIRQRVADAQRRRRPQG